jgi:hypothetical protein
MITTLADGAQSDRMREVTVACAVVYIRPLLTC